MLFNSTDFAAFLPVVFLMYWFVAKNNLKLQNLLLLGASYYFYACWDWRFLFLLMFSTLLDYFSGLKIFDAKTVRQKRIWLWASILINVGFLGVFKYYNFFADSFADALQNLGVQISPVTLQVILPVGISFYTFHGLSYVLDIYKNKINPEKNIVDYSVFVSFFPLLVAGPIERATHLLPQIKRARPFDYASSVNGLRQILWGLFKKITIADNCAEYANMIFDSPCIHSGSTLVLGALFFTFQIYCDFSGYSDIAIGVARLFGIELLRNFAFPYFSRSIAEFWRRWHISLSSWFRDYLYIPLGGSRGATGIKIRNTLIVFLVSGFWHGANWTFLVWGMLNALYILPSVLLKTNRENIDIAGQGRVFPSIKEVLSIVCTFGLTVFAWIFFRAQSLEQAAEYIAGMCNESLFSLPHGSTFIGSKNHPMHILFLLIIFLVVEWSGRESQYAIEHAGLKWPKSLRWAFYLLIAWSVFLFMGREQQFIYFQF